MKIKDITWQHRNDFSAVLECEHCGHNQRLGGGYNDHFYHNSVLPSIRCNSCDRDRAGSLPAQPLPQETADPHG